MGQRKFPSERLGVVRKGRFAMGLADMADSG